MLIGACDFAVLSTGDGYGSGSDSNYGYGSGSGGGYGYGGLEYGYCAAVYDDADPA